jgi:hypothetical protein
VPIDGGSSIEIEDSACQDDEWKRTHVDDLSPEGATVVGHHYYSLPDECNHVFAFSLDDRSSIRLSDGTWGCCGEVAPDGSRAVYQGDGYDLYSTPLAGGASIKLSGPMAPGGWVIGPGAISPDSLRIAYRADQDMNDVYEIYAARLLGSDPVKLNGPMTVQGDVCDSCGFVWAADGLTVVYNADQDTDEVVEIYSARLVGDADGDGVLPSCDCAPADPGVFAEPPEVSGVRFEERETLAWTTVAPDAGDGTAYDVLRGNVGGLPVGQGASETCLQPGLADTTWQDGDDPALGAAFYYLVRATNACGMGTYGTRSSGAERVSSACP